MSEHGADAFAYATGAIMGHVNRQGVNTANIIPGDSIVYQCGTATAPKIASVLKIPPGGYKPNNGIHTSAGTIAYDYVLAIVPPYRAPPKAVYQTPEEVVQIAVARLAGRDIYRRNKGTNDVWERCEGNFQFNFVAGEYKVGE